MKFILGTLAAAVLASVAFAQPAEARCRWDGYGWRCWHPHHQYWNGYHHHYRGDYYRGDYYRGW